MFEKLISKINISVFEPKVMLCSLLLTTNKRKKFTRTLFAVSNGEQKKRQFHNVWKDKKITCLFAVDNRTRIGSTFFPFERYDIVFLVFAVNNNE